MRSCTASWSFGCVCEAVNLSSRLCYTQISTRIVVARAVGVTWGMVRAGMIILVQCEALKMLVDKFPQAGASRA